MTLFQFGCKFTVEYMISGLIGGLAAVLILPGHYVEWPHTVRVDGTRRTYLGVFARLIIAAIFGCVVDCNPRNAFFGGFFSWHLCRWLSEDGWKYIKSLIRKES